MGDVIGFQAHKDKTMIAEIERRINQEPGVPAEFHLIPLHELALELDMTAVDTLWRFELQCLGNVVRENDGYIRLDQCRYLPYACAIGMNPKLGLLRHYEAVARAGARGFVKLEGWLATNPDLLAVVNGSMVRYSIRQVVSRYLIDCGYGFGETSAMQDDQPQAVKDWVAGHSLAEYNRCH